MAVAEEILHKSTVHPGHACVMDGNAKGQDVLEVLVLHGLHLCLQQLAARIGLHPHPSQSRPCGSSSVGEKEQHINMNSLLTCEARDRSQVVRSIATTKLHRQVVLSRRTMRNDCKPDAMIQWLVNNGALDCMPVYALQKLGQ